MCMCVFIPRYKLYFCCVCSISLLSSSLYPIYRPGYISLLLLFISVNSKNMSGKVIIYCEQLVDMLQHMAFAYNYLLASVKGWWMICLFYCIYWYFTGRSRSDGHGAQ